MSEKKQGKRSAEEAEETKSHILSVAGGLFCELGYSRVSLRNISEQAGVSHSLIRYHFGSKENIWYAVSDALHLFIGQYIEQLVDDLPKHKASNVQFYEFVVRLLALLLVEPKPIQFISDTVRQEGKFVDYFLGKHGEEEKALITLRENYNHENPNEPINLWEIKWLLLNSAHSAATLKPVLNIVWNENTTDPEEILYRHWNLFNKQMAVLFNINQQQILHPKNLETLLLPYECRIKVCSVKLKEEE